MQLTFPRVEVPRAVAFLFLVALLVAAAVIALVVVGSRTQVPTPFGPATTGLFAFDRSGDIALATSDGIVSRTIGDLDSTEFGASWSLDGTRLAYWSSAGAGENARLMVVDAAGGSPRVLADDARIQPDLRASPPVWSPDGRSLVVNSEDGSLFRADVAGTDLRQVGSPDLGHFYPAWSPDGRSIAFVGHDWHGGPLYVLDLSTGVETRVSDHEAGAASWSPDGGRLAYFAPAEPGDIVIAQRDDAGAWSESVVLGGRTDDATPRWSNDGTRLAFLRLEGGGWRLMILPLDGGQPTEVADTSHDLVFALPCWSPDDRLISTLSAPFGPLTSDELTSQSDVAHLVFTVDGSVEPRRIPSVGGTSVDACSWQRLGG